MADDKRIIDLADASRSVEDPTLSDIFSKIVSNFKNLSHNIGRRVIQSDESERPLVLQNGWVQYSAQPYYGEPSFFKDAIGFVHVTGLITGGTTTDGTVVSNLPSGFRPKTRLLLCVINTGSVSARLDVLTNGDILVYNSAGSSYLSLSIPAFRAYR